MSDDRRKESSQVDRREQSDAWSAFSLVLSGLVVWGGVGWFAADRTGWAWPLPVGFLVGVAAGLYLVWLRYGKA